MQYALELFKSAQQLTGKTTFFQDHINRAQKALVESKKDNDFIYHERVPDAKSLPAIGKAPLAKMLPLPEKMGQSSKGKSTRVAKRLFVTLFLRADLFEALVPVQVLQAMAAYSVRKTDLVNTEIMRLREATQLMNRFIFSSLNLSEYLSVYILQHFGIPELACSSGRYIGWGNSSVCQG